MRGAAAALALLGALLLIRAQLQPGNDSGDASATYTDHLRHEGEARILVAHGLEVYRQPYGALNELGGVHAGLFPERTAPYPPLAILLHWPWSHLQPHAHRALVWLWALVAFAACAGVVRLVAPLTVIAEAWALLLAVPLLVGIGINGFIDGGYLLCAALGCLAWRDDRPRAALLWLALAGALHFRAAVFVPLALCLAWRLRRTATPWLAAAIAAPTLAAAVALTGTLGTIPADSPVHWSHLRLPLFALVAVSGALALFLWRKDEGLVALTVLAACGLALFERSHGWWHAGVLLGPGLVLAARGRTYGWHWPLLLAWTIASSYLSYRHPWSVFWTWVPFAT